MHDNTLTDDNRDKFETLAKNYNQQIKFYNVEKLCADKIDELRNLIPSINNSPLSIGTLYRLLLLDVIPQDIKKILYFDSDTVINLDVNKLFEIELNDKPLAAVSETKATGISPKAGGYLPLCAEGIISGDDYFNSGVLIMNLEQIRKEQNHLREGILFREEKFYDSRLLRTL